MSDQQRATSAVVDFVDRTRWQDCPPEAVRIAKRCVLDGLGVMLAGSTQDAGRILRGWVQTVDAKPESTAFGPEPFRSGASSAALLNGTSGHALDWDDTQLATSPDRIFGLLTHPTVPPMVAALAIGLVAYGAWQNWWLSLIVSVAILVPLAAAPGTLGSETRPVLSGEPE